MTITGMNMNFPKKILILQKIDGEVGIKKNNNEIILVSKPYVNEIKHSKEVSILGYHNNVDFNNVKSVKNEIVFDISGKPPLKFCTFVEFIKEFPLFSKAGILEKAKLISNNLADLVIDTNLGLIGGPSIYLNYKIKIRLGDDDMSIKDYQFFSRKKQKFEIAENSGIIVKINEQKFEVKIQVDSLNCQQSKFILHISEPFLFKKETIKMDWKAVSRYTVNSQPMDNLSILDKCQIYNWEKLIVHLFEIKSSLLDNSIKLSSTNVIFDNKVFECESDKSTSQLTGKVIRKDLNSKNIWSKLGNINKIGSVINYGYWLDYVQFTYQANSLHCNKTLNLPVQKNKYSIILKGTQHDITTQIGHLNSNMYQIRAWYDYESKHRQKVKDVLSFWMQRFKVAEHERSYVSSQAAFIFRIAGKNQNYVNFELPKGETKVTSIILDQLNHVTNDIYDYLGGIFEPHMSFHTNKDEPVKLDFGDKENFIRMTALFDLLHMEFNTTINFVREKQEPGLSYKIRLVTFEGMWVDDKYILRSSLAKIMKELFFNRGVSAKQQQLIFVRKRADEAWFLGQLPWWVFYSRYLEPALITSQVPISNNKKDDTEGNSVLSAYNDLLKKVDKSIKSTTGCTAVSFYRGDCIQNKAIDLCESFYFLRQGIDLYENAIKSTKSGLYDLYMKKSSDEEYSSSIYKSSTSNLDPEITKNIIDGLVDLIAPSIDNLKYQIHQSDTEFIIIIPMVKPEKLISNFKAIIIGNENESQSWAEIINSIKTDLQDITAVLVREWLQIDNIMNRFNDISKTKSPNVTLMLPINFSNKSILKSSAESQSLSLITDKKLFYKIQIETTSSKYLSNIFSRYRLYGAIWETNDALFTHSLDGKDSYTTHDEIRNTIRVNSAISTAHDIIILKTDRFKITKKRKSRLNYKLTIRSDGKKEKQCHLNNGQTSMECLRKLTNMMSENGLEIINHLSIDDDNDPSNNEFKLTFSIDERTSGNICGYVVNRKNQVKHTGTNNRCRS